MLMDEREAAWERGNRDALREYREREGESAVLVVNSLIEQRARRGWDLEDWMVMRDVDTGRPVSREWQEEHLDRIRRMMARIRAEHRVEQPTCPDCLEERRN